MYHWKTLVAERERLARLRKGEPADDAPPVQVNVPLINKPPPAAPVAVAAPIPTPTTHRAIVALPVSTPGRAICVECVYYSRRDCTNNRARSPVTGTAVEATTARKDKFSCGPTGRYWEARMATPRKPIERDGSEPMEYVPPVPVRRLEVFHDEVVAMLYEPAHIQPKPFLMYRVQ